MINYTYLVRCTDGTLYCGWTNCLEKRIRAHNSGKGAKYTKSRRPVTLAYYEEFATREEAMSRECAIKKLTRAEKEKLIASGYKLIHNDIMTEAAAQDEQMEDLM